MQENVIGVFYVKKVINIPRFQPKFQPENIKPL
jgi:hypothetical protein